MDQNRDGKLSYIEFAIRLEMSSNDIAIDDHTHWAFRIFEGIRRALF